MWAVLSGLLGGMLWYDWVHYRMHFGGLPGAWFQTLRRHHMRHHYKARTLKFGVTNLAWDRLLRT